MAPKPGCIDWWTAFLRKRSYTQDELFNANMLAAHWNTNPSGQVFKRPRDKAPRRLQKLGNDFSMYINVLCTGTSTRRNVYRLDAFMTLDEILDYPIDL